MKPEPVREAGIDGILHRAEGPHGLVVTHGAGGNRDMPLLVAIAGELQNAGVSVLRINLPFRQKKRAGAPSPSAQAADRDGLREAADYLRKRISGRLAIGGQSYGGRMASMLLAEQPAVASALLLLSYPLHPPGKPDRLRTEHLPGIRLPVLFIHGTRDPFGSIPEIESARKLIPGATTLSIIEGAGHDLNRGRFDLAGKVGAPFAAILEN